MAQIAGRAGRHQRDGSFGTLGLGGDGAPEFSEEEIAAIEEHRFRPLDHLYWRSADLDFTTTTDLIASLETRSDDPLLRSAPLAIDLAVLKLIAEDPSIAAQRGGKARKLWAVCGLPDFRKVGPMHHARMVRRLFSYIGEGGHIPHEWFAAEVTRLDNVAGDIEALADRLAGIRSWAYIAQRPDWLADPAKWAERTRAVEGRLSDALHERLTQRFVDRRTAVLVRDIGARGADALPVTVAADGEVSVGPEPIGHLAGLRVQGRPDRAAGRQAPAPRRRRAPPGRGARTPRRARCATPPTPTSAWSRKRAASRSAGTAMSSPASPRAAACSSPPCAPRARSTGCRRSAAACSARGWSSGSSARSRTTSPRCATSRFAAVDKKASPGVRALAAMLVDFGRPAARRAMAAQLAALDKTDRHALHRQRVRLGALDIYLQPLLKPAAIHWRAALLSIRAGLPMPRLPQQPAATLDGSADPRGAALGFRRLGATWLRVDLADRLATHAHHVKAQQGQRSDRPCARDQPRARRRYAQAADGRNRLRPGRRGMEMARQLPPVAPRRGAQAGQRLRRPRRVEAALAYCCGLPPGRPGCAIVPILPNSSSKKLRLRPSVLV